MELYKTYEESLRVFHRVTYSSVSRFAMLTKLRRFPVVRPEGCTLKKGFQGLGFRVKI